MEKLEQRTSRCIELKLYGRTLQTIDAGPVVYAIFGIGQHWVGQE